MVLVVFQIINDVDCLFMCFFTVCICSFARCLFKSFAQFLKNWVFVLLSCQSSLYILHTNSLLDIFVAAFFL